MYELRALIVPSLPAGVVTVPVGLPGRAGHAISRLGTHWRGEVTVLATKLGDIRALNLGLLNCRVL